MLELLILIALVVGIIAVGKVLRVMELASSIKGENSWQANDRDHQTQSRLMLVFLFAYFAFIIWQVWKWGDTALPVSASEHGVTIDGLMTTTWIIIIPVFIITLGNMLTDQIEKRLSIPTTINWS